MLPCPRSCALEPRETMNKIYELTGDESGDVSGACCLYLLKKNATSLPPSTKSQFIDFAPGNRFDVQAPYKN